MGGLSRRDFLKFSGAVAAAVLLSGCRRGKNLLDLMCQDQISNECLADTADLASYAVNGQDILGNKMTKTEGVITAAGLILSASELDIVDDFANAQRQIKRILQESGVLTAIRTGDDAYEVYKIGTNGNEVARYIIRGNTVLNDGVSNLDEVSRVIINTMNNATPVIEIGPGLRLGNLGHLGVNHRNEFIIAIDNSDKVAKQIRNGSIYDFLNNTGAQGVSVIYGSLVDASNGRAILRAVMPYRSGLALVLDAKGGVRQIVFGGDALADILAQGIAPETFIKYGEEVYNMTFGVNPPNFEEFYKRFLDTSRKMARATGSYSDEYLSFRYNLLNQLPHYYQNSGFKVMGYRILTQQLKEIGTPWSIARAAANDPIAWIVVSP